MTDTIKVTGLSLANQKPWDNGDRALAFFDCETRGIALCGCVLIRTSRGFLLAQGPRGDSQRVGARAIQIVDSALRKDLAAAAHRAFLALGGAE